jgi:hypothetical protein
MKSTFRHRPLNQEITTMSNDTQPSTPAPLDGSKGWDELSPEEQAARRNKFWTERGQNANAEKARGK